MLANTPKKLEEIIFNSVPNQKEVIRLTVSIQCLFDTVMHYTRHRHKPGCTQRHKPGCTQMNFPAQQVTTC